MKKIAKLTQKSGYERKDAVNRRRSNHGVHKRGNCPLCEKFNYQRSDKIKIHVKKAHPDRYGELYGAPNGAPDGAPDQKIEYIHKENCNCFVPGLIVDASTQTRITM